MGEKPSAESVRVPWQPDFIFSEQRSGWAVARPRDHNLAIFANTGGVLFSPPR